MLWQIDIQFPTDNLKYQGCPEEPKLAIFAQSGEGVNADGQPDRKISAFFDDFPNGNMLGKAMKNAHIQ